MKSFVIFFGIAFLSVSGCVNFSPMSDPSPFSLMPLPQVEQSQEHGTGETNNMFIGIGPIRFPAYLDREQIVTRTAQNRLDISENDRWAEPLEENFTRVLSQNLGMHRRRSQDHPISLAYRPAPYVSDRDGSASI